AAGAGSRPVPLRALREVWGRTDLPHLDWLLELLAVLGLPGGRLLEGGDPEPGPAIGPNPRAVAAFDGTGKDGHHCALRTSSPSTPVPATSTPSSGHWPTSARRPISRPIVTASSPRTGCSSPGSATSTPAWRRCAPWTALASSTSVSPVAAPSSGCAWACR